jgi:proline iminopeptidase
MTAPLESHVPLNGCRHWVVTQGSGPPVVLLHGGPGACDYLGSLAAMLDNITTIIRYDQRGCGRTDRTPPYDVATYLADLDALRRHLDFERWTLIGHSWGACLGLAYAVAHPTRVERLALVSAHGLLGAGPHSDAYRASMRARFSPDELARWDELKARLRREPKPSRAECEAIVGELVALQEKTEVVPGTDPGRVPRFPCPGNDEVNTLLNADWRRHAATEPFQRGARGLTMPVLALHGDYDPRPAASVAAYVQSLPAGSYHAIPAAGHFPWAEAPDAVAAALRSFLAGSAARI